MPLNLSKAKIIGRHRGLLLVLLLAAALAGCSTLRFAYDRGETLAYWWLDGYADFTSAQAPRVHEALAAWFRWHRTTQLGTYATLLVRAEREVQADADADEACRWTPIVREQLRAAFDQALPALADIALSLSPAQLEHLARRYAKNNEEFRADFLQEPPEARMRASVKRTVERAETLYGALQPAQRDWIAHRLAVSPFDPERWLAERMARQQDILATLRGLHRAGGDAGRAEAEAALRGVAERFEHSPREAWRRYDEQLTADNCAFAAGLHNTTTLPQRQFALRKISGWEHDLRMLAVEPD